MGLSDKTGASKSRDTLHSSTCSTSHKIEFVSFFVLAECFESGSDKTRLDKTKSVNAANIYFSFTSHCYLLSNSFFLSLVFRSLYYHLLLFYILYFTFCFLLIYFSSFLGSISFSMSFLPNNARRKMSM